MPKIHCMHLDVRNWFARRVVFNVGYYGCVCFKMQEDEMLKANDPSKVQCRGAFILRRTVALFDEL